MSDFNDLKKIPRLKFDFTFNSLILLSEMKGNFLQVANIKINCNNYDVVIISIYFPPRHSVKCPDYDQFFKSLGQRFILGGDYNDYNDKHFEFQIKRVIEVDV